MTTDRRLLLAVLMAIAVGACGSASAPSAVPTASPPPGPSLGPDAPITDVPSDTGDQVLDPTAGRVVAPKPGQLDVHPIAAETLSATLEGRRVIVTVSYTSGVEPCYILDSIVVETGASSFEITLREGHGPEDVACIEIAEFKRAIVDLGELAPGTYTISDGAGGAAPISVTVD